MTGRMLRTSVCLAILVATHTLAQTAPSPAPDAQHPVADQPFSSLPAQIATLLADPAVARDHWGIMVTSLDGAQIFALNEAQLFQPASNAKLYTTSTAMALLGPERRLETRVTGALDPAGIVKATSHSSAQATPISTAKTFPTSHPPLAQGRRRTARAPPAQPHARHPGPRRPTRRQRRQENQRRHHRRRHTLPLESLPAGLVHRRRRLGIRRTHQRTHHLRQPAPTLHRARRRRNDAIVTLEQAVPYYTVQNEAHTVATKSEATGIQVTRTIGSRVLASTAPLLWRMRPTSEHVAIEDPAEFAAMALRAALIEHGIAVTGIARAKHRPVTDAAGFLATVHRSVAEDQAVATRGIEVGSCLMRCAPERRHDLGDSQIGFAAADITFTNKVSQNLHAELLLKSLARRSGCSKGSTAEGARLSALTSSTPASTPTTSSSSTAPASSGHDLVTPRATAKLLQFATTQPWFAAWRASLPIGGEDGSLASRFAQPPLKDHVFAKTGTLSEARALSGYLDCRQRPHRHLLHHGRQPPPGHRRDRSSWTRSSPPFRPPSKRAGKQLPGGYRKLQKESALAVDFRHTRCTAFSRCPGAL